MLLAVKTAIRSAPRVAFKIVRLKGKVRAMTMNEAPTSSAGSEKW